MIMLLKELQILSSKFLRNFVQMKKSVLNAQKRGKRGQEMKIIRGKIIIKKN